MALAKFQWPTFPSIIDRDYSTFYYILNDQCFYVQQHLNGLFVIGLASVHPLRRSNFNVVQADYSAGVHDFNAGVTSGKRKRDAVSVFNDSVLCVLRTEQGAEFSVPACVGNTKVIAINKLLAKDPNLVISDSENRGWIAIVMRKSTKYIDTKKILVSKEEYVEYAKKFTNTTAAEHTNK